MLVVRTSYEEVCLAPPFSIDLRSIYCSISTEGNRLTEVFVMRAFLVEVFAHP